MISRTKDPLTLQSLRKEDFVVGSVLYCRPPGGFPPTGPMGEEALANCRAYWSEWIKENKPRAILALGNVAFQALTGEWGIDKLRGYEFRTPYGKVVGSYAPSYIRMGKFSHARVFMSDLLKAMAIASGKDFSIQKHYTLTPSVYDMERYKDSYFKAGCPPLAFDIETPYASVLKDEAINTDIEDITIEDDASYTIIRASFSFKRGEAISFPWIPPFIDYAKEMLSSKGEKMVWNGNFDIPRLAYNNVPVRGRIIDSMHAWHFLEPSLPMGLKFAATFSCPDMGAWKLESSSRPEFYSAADSDVLWRTHFYIVDALKAQGRWDIFSRHCVDLLQVLNQMSLIGVRTDGEKRKWKKRAFDRLYGWNLKSIQKHIPLELKPKKVYKKTEEQLRKMGAWVEGAMVTVVNMEKPPKPKKIKPVKEKKVKIAKVKKERKSRKTKDAPTQIPLGL